MRTLAAVSVVGFMILANALAQDETSLKKELGLLVGKWDIIKVETGGGATNEDPKGSSVQFAKDGKQMEFIGWSLAAAPV